ncbi:MAG: DUF1345 domain-containing protein [Alphaproteobacteria bacterium]|nr:DUF1345 domain-containing protein [Alphaproteobacteria bacterium]MDE2629860.1 DUF1345 domain-containing protein [Alphaproteobacteria bacterium]
MRLAQVPAAAGAAGDAFFAVYLAASAWLLLTTANADARRCADTEDEGIMVVAVIALAAVTFNVVDIFIVLNQQHRADLPSLAVALAAAPLGWCMLHTIAAFHYANLYYSVSCEETSERTLEFPGTENPNLWDFVYFSFVVGMTAQVSDVQIRTTAMRRAVTGHSVVSFFFNTVLIAMAVNAAVAGAG